MTPSGPVSEETARPARGVRILGVPVRLHFTFVLLVIFIVTLGARGGESAAFSAIYILSLFTSVLLHELGHAGVSKRYGIRTLDIVLYPIGGVARMERTPKPPEELWIALAGPFVNVLIATALFAYLGYMRADVNLTSLANPSDANLLARVAIGNLILAAFNLIPAFPMDGGRVLRALLARKQSEEQATRTAASAGRDVRDIDRDVWIAVYAVHARIHCLLRLSRRHRRRARRVVGRSLTEGVPVRKAMITEFRTLEHGTTVREAANMLLATSQQDFPIVLGEQVMGLLGRNALLRGMAVDGPDAYVAGIMDRNFPRVSPDDSLTQAIPLLAQTSCVLVMDQERLLGLLTRENLSEFMMLRRFGMAADTPA